MDRTSGLPLELKATLHARSPTRTRSTSHQLIAGDALYAAPDTLPRSGFVHGRRAVIHRPLSQRLLRVCAVIRRRFPVGASPTRQPLQPEATGAVMEVTKWLKPSDSGSRIGDRASVQAATRVNPEQALYEEGKVKRVVSGGIC